MAVFEPIIQGLREWIYQTTGLARERIIPSDDPFVRPELPYIMLDIMSLDMPGGTDEAISGTSSADQPIVFGRGFRTGTITVNGFGPSAADLIMQATVQLVHPSILKLMCDNGFSLRPISPLMDISELVSDRIEKRFAKDFELQYLLVDTDPEVLTELSLINVNLTLEESDGDVDALIDTLIINC